MIYLKILGKTHLKIHFSFSRFERHLKINFGVSETVADKLHVK
jgi:hypothetical protein